MMNRRLHKSAFLIIGMMLFFSCNKTAEGTQGPAGAPGADGLNGIGRRSGITGYVQLIDQFSQPVTSNDKVTVSTRMGDSALSVTTDVSGLFLLPALKSGSYRLMFKRDGYDSFGVNVTHSAGNEDRFIGIAMISGTQTTHFEAQTITLHPSAFDDGTKYADIYTTVTNPPIGPKAQRFLDMYFSDHPNVSSKNYLYNYTAASNGEMINKFLIQVGFGSTDINDIHFHAGDTVFVKTYIIPSYYFANNNIGSWFDTNTYQTVKYPYVGDSLSNFFIWTE